MCQSGKYILFCTCEDDSVQESQDNAIEWTLYRPVEEIISVSDKDRWLLLAIGKALPSVDQLNGGFTVAQLLDSLNKTQAFDFEYTPNGQDILVVSEGKCNYKRMFFCFSGEYWVACEGSPSFPDDSIPLTFGKLKMLSSPPNEQIKPSGWTKETLSNQAKAHLKELQKNRPPTKWEFIVQSIKRFFTRS